ncbi:DUF2946 domain-containing protein [Serratia proteamaculans]|uniref:DUF2946 domain-containing protein n=1 Tax=Serratia proteamaculans TaxID=28151 RepID=UPI001F1131FC|nr:DUF2946 domain-containing protein [Serratia proteamaculans]
MKLSIQHMRTLAWLGLFAMLMIFIAPPISTRLEINNINNKEMMANMPMGEEHAGPMVTMHPVAENTTPAGHNMADMAAGACFDFCGYCGLFNHTPPLVELPAVAVTHDLQRAPTLISVIYKVISFPLFPPYQTRAPPLLYFFVKQL